VSLVVSSSQDGRYSRMTITAKGEAEKLDQMIRQVNKLVDVLHCIDHTEHEAVFKEMALVKIEATDENRTAILQIADHFASKTVDMTPTSMILMITGDSSKLDAAIDLLRNYRIIELVRTGKVVMARGSEET